MRSISRRALMQVGMPSGLATGASTDLGLRSMNPGRAVGWVGAALGAAVFAACGGQDVASESSDAATDAIDGSLIDRRVGTDAAPMPGREASAPDAGGGDEPDAVACAPALADSWTPTWRPPNAPISGACTEDQLHAYYASCSDPTTSSTTACDAVKRNPAYQTCLSCMFSSQDELTYGALVRRPNGSWYLNSPGCMALVDGDMTAGGCGAKYQAFKECADAACFDVCPTFDTFTACWNQTTANVCQSYFDGSVCREQARYAICLDYPTNLDEFIALGRMFCVAGLDAGTAVDAADTGVEAGDAEASVAVDDGSVDALGP